MFRKLLRCRRHVCVLRPKRWGGCDQISIETSCNVALWGSQAILAIPISLALVSLDDCGGFRDPWTNGFGSSATVPPLDWLGRAWALGAMAKVRVSLSGSWKLPVIMDWWPLIHWCHSSMWGKNVKQSADRCKSCKGLSFSKNITNILW